AKAKRTEIELRAAHDAARAAAGPNARYAPPEHAQRIAELEAERAQRAAELAAVAQAADRANAAARTARDAQREAHRRVEAVREERARLDRTREHQVGVGVEGVRAAGDARRAAYAMVGRELLERFSKSIPPVVSDSARAASKRLLEARKDLE